MRLPAFFATRISSLKELREYFNAVRVEWVNVAWGVGVPAVAFIILWSLEVITDKRKIAYFFVWALFMAGYYVWRAEHVQLQEIKLQLQPAFAITKVLAQTWIDQDTGRHGTGYYFEVINTSETTSILDAEAQLSEIIPTVENLEWLPVHLEQKHDRSKPREKTFDLHPGKSKHIDFVSAFERGNQFTVLHIVSGVNCLVTGREHRHLRVTITGKDVPALSARFEVYFDEEGFFKCEMEHLGGPS
jgi:hypothetical protein